MSSRVYVVNETLVYNEERREMEPAHRGIRKAARYGTMVHLLPAGPLPNNMEDVAKAIREKLANFSDDDFILPVGDPVAIGLAGAFAAAANHGRVNYLRWMRDERMYTVVETDMGLEMEES